MAKWNISSVIIFSRENLGGSKVKTCTIYGDLTSDRAGDNYPTVQVCDDCVEDDEKLQEDSQIVIADEYDPNLGDTCAFCEKTYKEELQEQHSS